MRFNSLCRHSCRRFSRATCVPLYPCFLTAATVAASTSTPEIGSGAQYRPLLMQSLSQSLSSTESLRHAHVMKCGENEAAPDFSSFAAGVAISFMNASKRAHTRPQTWFVLCHSSHSTRASGDAMLSLQSSATSGTWFLATIASRNASPTDRRVVQYKNMIVHRSLERGRDQMLKPGDG